jgi:hypothetical protein
MRVFLRGTCRPDLPASAADGTLTSAIGHIAIALPTEGKAALEDRVEGVPVFAPARRARFPRPLIAYPRNSRSRRMSTASLPCRSKNISTVAQPARA